jgi:hypothetical protein
VNKRVLALANGKRISLYSLDMDSNEPIAEVRDQFKAMRVAFNHEENYIVTLFQEGVIKVHRIN